MFVLNLFLLLLLFFKDIELTEASLRLAKDFLDVVRVFVTECRFFLRNNTVLQSSINSKLLLTVLYNFSLLLLATFLTQCQF